MKTRELLQQKREEILHLADRYGASTFASLVRLPDCDRG